MSRRPTAEHARAGRWTDTPTTTPRSILPSCACDIPTRPPASRRLAPALRRAMRISLPRAARIRVAARWPSPRLLVRVGIAASLSDGDHRGLTWIFERSLQRFPSSVRASRGRKVSPGHLESAPGTHTVHFPGSRRFHEPRSAAVNASRSTAAAACSRGGLARFGARARREGQFRPIGERRGETDACGASSSGASSSGGLPCAMQPMPGAASSPAPWWATREPRERAV